MKVFFTKKEYKLLIRMLGIADRVMEGIERNAESDKAYEAFFQKMLLHAKEMGLEDEVKYSKETHDCYFEDGFNEELEKQYLKPYNDHNFWEDLIFRLALRDLVKQYSLEGFDAMDRLEKIAKIESASIKYATEFDTKGLDFLKLPEH